MPLKIACRLFIRNLGLYFGDCTPGRDNAIMSKKIFEQEQLARAKAPFWRESREKSENFVRTFEALECYR